MPYGYIKNKVSSINILDNNENTGKGKISNARNVYDPFHKERSTLESEKRTFETPSKVFSSSTRGRNSLL